MRVEDGYCRPALAVVLLPRCTGTDEGAPLLQVHRRLTRMGILRSREYCEVCVNANSFPFGIYVVANANNQLRNAGMLSFKVDCSICLFVIRTDVAGNVLFMCRANRGFNTRQYANFSERFFCCFRDDL
ncbi:unnamed protein product [Ectocarpus sp. 13 AM-2016]